MKHRPFFFLRLAAPCCLAFLLPGCGGPKNFLNDNDQLRRENLELTRQVETLDAQLQNRLGQIQALQKKNSQGELPPGADPPVVSGLKIDSYGGPIDTDRDGTDDLIRLYLLPTDQQGRMIPVAAALTAALVILPDQGEPQVIAQRSFTPAELDAAYRDGFTGPYYLCELPLPQPPPQEVTVRCVLQPLGAATIRAQVQYRVQISAPITKSP